MTCCRAGNYSHLQQPVESQNHCPPGDYSRVSLSNVFWNMAFKPTSHPNRTHVQRKTNQARWMSQTRPRRRRLGILITGTGRPKKNRAAFSHRSSSLWAVPVSCLGCLAPKNKVSLGTKREHCPDRRCPHTSAGDGGETRQGVAKIPDVHTTIEMTPCPSARRRRPLLTILWTPHPSPLVAHMAQPYGA